jgi:hypothetical protein
LTEKENPPRATGARTSLKKKPALPLARAERKPFDRKKNIPRATGARTISGSLLPLPHKRELQQPEKYRYLQNKIRSFSITT